MNTKDIPQKVTIYFWMRELDKLYDFTRTGLIVSRLDDSQIQQQEVEIENSSIDFWRFVRRWGYWPKKIVIEWIVQAMNSEHLGRIMATLKSIILPWFSLWIKKGNNEKPIIYKNCRMENQQIFQMEGHTIDVVKFNFEIVCEDWYWTKMRRDGWVIEIINENFSWDRIEKNINLREANLTDNLEVRNLQLKLMIDIVWDWKSTVAFRIKNLAEDEKIEFRDVQFNNGSKMIINFEPWNLWGYYITKSNTIVNLAGIWDFTDWMHPFSNNEIRIYVSNPSIFGKCILEGKKIY